MSSSPRGADPDLEFLVSSLGLSPPSPPPSPPPEPRFPSPPAGMRSSDSSEPTLAGPTLAAPPGGTLYDGAYGSHKPLPRRQPVVLPSDFLAVPPSHAVKLDGAWRLTAELSRSVFAQHSLPPSSLSHTLPLFKNANASYGLTLSLSPSGLVTVHALLSPALPPPQAPLLQVGDVLRGANDRAFPSGGEEALRAAVKYIKERGPPLLLHLSRGAKPGAVAAESAAPGAAVPRPPARPRAPPPHPLAGTLAGKGLIRKGDGLAVVSDQLR
ncbi:hypothetical protein TeGR_g14740, partial [Tetraparma gracilis]